jgi:hypothetical protein
MDMGNPMCRRRRRSTIFQELSAGALILRALVIAMG